MASIEFGAVTTAATAPPDGSRAEADAVAAAIAELAQGRLEAAAAMLEPWVDRCTTPDALTTLARVRSVTGHLKESLALLRQAEQRFADDPRVWKALAAMLRVLGKSKAELEYRRKLVYFVVDPPTAAYVSLAQAAAEVCRKDPRSGWGEMKFASNKLARLPIEDEADRLERLWLAQSLYLVEALKDDAYRHYLQASPVGSCERDVSVTWARLDRWCKFAGVPIVRSAQLGRVGDRPMLAELSRVAVLPGLQWTPVLDEAHAAIDGFFMHLMKFRAESLDSPLLLHRPSDRSRLRLPAELPVHAGPALLLGGMPQYYHQTVEFLGTLAVAEALGAPAELPLVVNDDLAPFQLEQFAMLGIGEDRLIRVAASAPVRFERLWVATRPVRSGRWIDPLMPAWYRKRLALPEGPGHRKLYVSRAGTDRRRIANETALFERLAARGFEFVRPETLSVREQVAMFADASHIVGPTGAALANMVFAPVGACVVSIHHRAFEEVNVDKYFDALALACGHRYVGVAAGAVTGHASRRPIDADIEVELAHVEAALD